MACHDTKKMIDLQKLWQDLQVALPAVLAVVNDLLNAFHASRARTATTCPCPVEFKDHMTKHLDCQQKAAVTVLADNLAMQHHLDECCDESCK